MTSMYQFCVVSVCAVVCGVRVCLTNVCAHCVVWGVLWHAACAVVCDVWGL